MTNISEESARSPLVVALEGELKRGAVSNALCSAILEKAGEPAGLSQCLLDGIGRISGRLHTESSDSGQRAELEAYDEGIVCFVVECCDRFGLNADLIDPVTPFLHLRFGMLAKQLEFVTRRELMETLALKFLDSGLEDETVNHLLAALVRSKGYAEDIHQELTDGLVARALELPSVEGRIVLLFSIFRHTSRLAGFATRIREIVSGRVGNSDAKEAVLWQIARCFSSEQVSLAKKEVLADIVTEPVACTLSQHRVFEEEPHGDVEQTLRRILTFPEQWRNRVLESCASHNSLSIIARDRLAELKKGDWPY